MKAEAMCAFSDSRSFEKTFAEVTWFFSSFARYRAGGEPCRSGSVIGASLAASLAPMAQSGGDGRWRHRAEVTGAGGTGRKLVFWWRSCSQVRHAGGTCGAGGSEGGTPLSRDGVLLYSRAPGGVVIGVSWFRAKAVVRFRSCCGGMGLVGLLV